MEFLAVGNPSWLGGSQLIRPPSLIGKQRKVWAGHVLRWLRQPSRAGYPEHC